MPTRVTDQIAHFLLALAILTLFSLGGVFSGAAAGLCLGLIREASEAGGSRITFSEVVWHFRHKTDPWIDLAFWTLGGAVAGLLN